MRIIYMTDEFPPESFGGAGQVVFDSARIMQAHGHSVGVLASTTIATNHGRDTYSNIPVTRLYFPQKSQFARAYLAAYNPFLSGKIKRFLVQEKPDIIHLHNVHRAISFMAVKWAKKSGAKVFFTAHDTLSFSYTRLYHFIDPKNLECRKNYDYRLSWQFLMKENGKAYNPLRNWLIKRCLNRYADKIFAVSAELKKALEQNGIKNVKVLYNGVKISDFQAGSDEVSEFKKRHGLNDKKIIFFGGRGMADKGPEILLSALPHIISRCPDVLLVMAIEHDDYEERLKNIVHDQKLDTFVRFPGLFHGERLAAMFGASTVVAVPSIYLDPAPLMDMQAMTAGRPVVGTCFGGTPEMVLDGIAGLIVNPYDLNALTDAIVKLLKDDTLSQRLGRAGYGRMIGNFSIEKYGERLLEEYGIDV